MKQKLCVLALVLACVLIFAGCQCEHKWNAATCEEPKTCELCGVVEGDPQGHSWKPATCNADLVEKMVKLMELMDYEVASPAEAKAILGIEK